MVKVIWLNTVGDEFSKSMSLTSSLKFCEILTVRNDVSGFIVIDCEQ